MLALRRLVANVANNVNQIARVANNSGLDEVRLELQVTLEAARRASDNIFDFVDLMLPKRGS
ncbi:plasmid mobilization relaxosome protein MobC [Nakamurella deserti]|uniref:plasmid mobilization relaxosome protein MobC n=1 Tax=Nakamurella deserti TaxID=2164074 RepID=UPI000DBE8839